MNSILIQAEPSAVQLNLDETALIIIDMQKDFLYHDGFGEFLGNDVTLLQRTIAPTQAVLRAWRTVGLTVIHTREGHLPDMSDCPPTKLDRWLAPHIGDAGPMGRIMIRGEVGNAIVDELTPLPGEIEIDKPGKNAFYNTNLKAILNERGIRNLIVAGVTTDVCVFTTTTGANDHGINAIVLADCVASYSPERHLAALKIIKAQGGIFGWVSDSARLMNSATPDAHNG